MYKNFIGGGDAHLQVNIYFSLFTNVSSSFQIDDGLKKALTEVQKKNSTIYGDLEKIVCPKSPSAIIIKNNQTDSGLLISLTLSLKKKSNLREK